MRQLPWQDMLCTRPSIAWSPDDGSQAGVNSPRIARNKVLRWDLPAELLYSFPETQGYCAYDIPSSGAYQSPNTTDWLPDIRAAFEAVWPGTILALGNSYEGRPIYGYRLGAADRPHFVVTAMVHGNEGDGHPGTYKAVELLATHPSFASFREQYTIFFVSELNPDGYYHWTRGLAQEVTSKQINLNRVFDWFWADYLESNSESKGSVVEQPLEAKALLDYWRTGNDGGQVGFACLMDIHGTEGDGYRYQSRERLLGEYDAHDHLRQWFDWWTWRHVGGLQAKRVAEDGQPDLYTNYFRSRFRPHLHPYFQTRLREENNGIPPVSMVAEHNKVQFVLTDEGLGETYASACNYHVDYITTAALLMAGGTYEERDAVLVEGFETKNLLVNANWGRWQPEELRPSYFNSGRCEITRADDKFLERNGEALLLTTDLDLVIPGGEDARLYGGVCTNPTFDKVYYFCDNQLISVDQKSTTGNLLELSSPAGLPASHLGLAMTSTSSMWVVGDGQAVRLTETSDGVWATAATVVLTAGLQDCAVTADGTDLYIAGGSIAGVAQSAVYHINSSDTLATLGSLTTAVWGAYAAFSGTTLTAIGGATAASTTIRTIQQFNVSTGLPLADLAATGTPLADGVVYGGGWTSEAGDHWIYGGFYGDASDLLPVVGIARFDLSAGEWIDEVLYSERYDEQDLHDSTTPDRYWTNARGGWAAAALHPEDEPAEWMVYVFGGGFSPTDTAQTSEEIRVHDVRDDRFVKLSSSDYGYLRNNVHLDAELPELPLIEESFDGVDPTYSVLAGTLTTVGGSGARVDAATTEISWTVASSHGINYVATTTGTLINFRVFIGQAADPTSGYEVVVDATTWEIWRVVSGSQTTLMADGLTTLTAGAYRFIVDGDSPVKWAFYKGTSRLSFGRDFSSLRKLGPWTTITHEVEVAAAGDLFFTEAGIHETLWDSGSFAASLQCKAVDSTRAPHVRMNLAAGDSLTKYDISARSCRNYYLAPPQAQWWWLRGAVKLGGKYSEVENELRWYLPRVYKDAGVIVDAPVLTRGLRPPSWVEEGETRSAEQMSWEQAVDLGHLDLTLDWLPTASFLHLEEDTQLINISNGNQSLQLWGCVGDDLEQREYNRYDVYGPVDPALELRLVDVGGTKATCRVSVFWGTTFKDAVRDLWDDHIVLRFRHLGAYGLQLDVTRGCATGSAWEPTALNYGGLADVTLLDGGYFTRPEVDTTNGWDFTDNPTGAIFAGELDPTFGKIDEVAWDKGVGDDFDRDDDSNLGSKWDVILQVSAGWDIESEQAVVNAGSSGWERWDSEPRLCLAELTANVTLSSIGDSFGFITRMDAYAVTNDQIFGYLCRATQQDATHKLLEIVSMWYDGTQQEEVLASTSVVSLAGAQITITCGHRSDRDLLTIYVGSTLRLSVSDTLYRRPGAVGIYGSAVDRVALDDVSMGTTYTTRLS